jgi:hypothetical protein
LRIVRKEPPKASASRSQTAITYRENRTSESEAGATSRAAIRKQINDDVRFSDCIRAKNIPATYACLFLLSCCEGIGFVARSRRATQILAPAQRALIIPKLPPSVMRRVVKTRPVESTRCKWTGTEKSGYTRKEKIGSREKVGHEKAGQDEKRKTDIPAKTTYPSTLLVTNCDDQSIPLGTQCCWHYCRTRGAAIMRPTFRTRH